MNNELAVQYEQNEILISNLQKAIDQAVSTTMQQLQAVQEQNNLIREQLRTAMEQNGVDKLHTETLTITLVKATSRTTVDSARLKKEAPEVFEKFSKTSPVKSSIRVTPKKAEADNSPVDESDILDLL